MLPFETAGLAPSTKQECDVRSTSGTGSKQLVPEHQGRRHVVRQLVHRGRRDTG